MRMIIYQYENERVLRQSKLKITNDDAFESAKQTISLGEDSEHQKSSKNGAAKRKFSWSEHLKKHIPEEIWPYRLQEQQLEVSSEQRTRRNSLSELEAMAEHAKDIPQKEFFV